MVRDFFSYLSNQNPEQLYWKALGSGQYIHRKGSFENKAKQCYNLSVKAIELESKNFYYTANLTWMEIYGSVYPKQYS
jgi:hypothetical protein